MKTEAEIYRECLVRVRDGLVTLDKKRDDMHSAHPGAHIEPVWGTLIDELNEALATPTAGEERDFTPEEALEYARKRWGEEAIINVDMDTDGNKYTGLLYWVTSGPEEEVFSATSFRSAFAQADSKKGDA